MSRQVQVGRRLRIGFGAMVAILVAIGSATESSRAFPLHPDRHAGGGRSVGRGLFQRAGRGGRPAVYPQDRPYPALGAEHAGRVSGAGRSSGYRRLRAALPGTASLVVVGECQYGVIARPKETAFLLRHFPRPWPGSPTS